MKSVLCVSALILALFCGLPAQAKEAGWVLASDKNGIKVYRKSDDESRIKTFRGVTRFRIDNPAALEVLLRDYDAAPRWLHFVSSTTEVSRRSSMDNSLYVTIQLPWPLADRDVVADMQFEKAGENTLLLHARDDVKAPRNEGYLRVPDFSGMFRMDFIPETKEVEVTYQIVVDPGGNVPAWAVNIVLKDMPYFTLMKISRMVGEPKYANAKGQFLDYAW